MKKKRRRRRGKEEEKEKKKKRKEEEKKKKKKLLHLSTATFPAIHDTKFTILQRSDLGTNSVPPDRLPVHYKILHFLQQSVLMFRVSLAIVRRYLTA